VEGTRSRGPESRVALLIDAENAPAAAIELVLSKVTQHGVVHVRRAYGNWKNPQLRPWEECLHALAIRPMQQFGYTAQKNATDIAMVIEAMDLMHTGSVDGVALMSSDADFTPLVMRLLSNGVKVYGYGERKTPAAFVNACSEFTYVDEAPSSDTKATPAKATPAKATPANTQRRSTSELRGDTRLTTLLRSAVGAAKAKDGWSALSAVGAQISAQQSSFAPSDYGFSKLGDLIEASGLFEIRRTGTVVSVRDPRKA
jgi:uncharacterized protein (TIGR00288 family)